MTRLPVLIASVLFLASCVVGDDDYAQLDEPAEETADPSVPFEADPSDPLDEEPIEDQPLHIFAGTPLLDADELAFLTKINQYRASLGKPALRVSVALTRASNYHSKDMADHNWFAHNSSDGTETFTRVRRYYNYNTYYGENIAVGYPDAAAVFTGWKNSPGHDANMKSANFTVIGISKVIDASGRAWWTTDFGGYKDAILSAGVTTIASNSGFESDAFTTGVDFNAVRTLQRWHLYGPGDSGVARTTGSAEAGSWGLRINDSATTKAVATQVVLGAAGVRYQVAARTRYLSGPSEQVVYLDFLRSDFSRISVFTQGTGMPTTWSTTTVSADAPSGTKYVRVLLYGPAAAGVASIHTWDSIKLTAL
jgi:uncharacterized protein YkwD